MRKLLGVALFFSSLSLFFFADRSLMAMGGLCAEGGSFTILRNCPKNVSAYIPLSIAGMLLATVVYFSDRSGKGPAWGCFFWTLFCLVLAWNFFEFALLAQTISYAWILNGLMFLAGAFSPFLFIKKRHYHSLSALLIGRNKEANEGQQVKKSILQIFSHVLAALAGIACGYWIFLQK